MNYEPLNICTVRRAVVMLWIGKAELVENGRGELRALELTIPVPSVIRIMRMVRKPLLRRKLSRREVFLRDRYTCQYCGRETRELTLDHVVPRYRGGEHSWTNVVSACIPCNHRKAGHTPAEASMRLLRAPAVPPANPYHVFLHYTPKMEEWSKFIPWSRKASHTPGD